MGAVHLEQGLNVEVAWPSVRLGGVLASWAQGGNVPLGATCGCVCFELPGRCVSSQKHQPAYLCAHKCGDTCPPTHPCLSAQLPPCLAAGLGLLPLPETPGDASRAYPGMKPPRPHPVAAPVPALPAAPAAQPYRWLLRRAGSQPPPSRAAAFCVLSRCASASPCHSQPSAARAPRRSPHRSQPHTQVNFSAFSSN